MTSNPRPAASEPAAPRWPALLVLLVGLELTSALCAWSVRNDLAERRALFERRADSFVQALGTRVQSYIDTLPGLTVFGVLRRSADDATFLQYVEAISLQRRYPDLALTFMADRIDDAQRASYVATVRADTSRTPIGHPEFDIRPPGQRPQYMVVRHTYPASPDTVGYDLFDPQQRYRPAVDRAIDAGHPVATGPLLLARDRFATDQPLLTSVVVRAALYDGGTTPATTAARRQQARGVVGVSFKVADLVRSVLGAELARQATLRITDAQAQGDGEAALVFDSRWQADDRAGAPASDAARASAVRTSAWLGAARPVMLQRQLAVADRRWVLEIGERDARWPIDDTTLWLFALGAALSASLAWSAHLLVRGRRRAEQQVAAATAALRQEQRQLQDSESRYRMLFANSMDAVLRTTPDGQVLAANPAACALFGRSEAELIALGRRGLVDRSDSRLVELGNRRASVGHAQGLLRMLRADGSRFEAEVAANTYSDVDGKPVGSVIVRDVTERIQLAERQARLAAILDATPDLVSSTDLMGQTVYLNRAARRLLGLADDAPLAGHRLTDGQPAWASQQTLALAVPTALRDGVWLGRSAVLTADGRELPVSQVILCHRNEQGEVTQLSSIARDLSALDQAAAERQALEGRLRETQRLESIGTLAGGVAHDFNNVLAAILGNVALARQDVGEAHPAQHSLGLIHQAAARARSLVQQILTFSRRTPAPQRTVQALQPLVHDALALLRATLSAGVTLDTQLDDAPLAVLADAAQVQQVVLNLCTNAWQAMPDGRGSVQIRLRARQLPQDAPHGAPAVGGTDPLALPAGRYARLSVRDDGQGMDAAIRARIFDPFFTTKPVGQGTGLGLAVVHGIVTSAGGAIEVDSTPGRGTTVAVWWPLVAAPPQPTDAPLADAPAAAAAPHHGVATPMGLPAPAPARGQRVLYVDDDAVVGMTVQALLQRAGYTVVCVDSGEQALQQLTADPHSADIVVTDFNMPGMSGLMLAQALQARTSGLPVVITSGYVTDDLQAAADSAGVRAVLYKEHTLERLATLVADVLAGRPVAAADADS